MIETPPITEIADLFSDPAEPADFPETTLRFRNQRAAESVGLDNLSDQAWIDHFV